MTSRAQPLPQGSEQAHVMRHGFISRRRAFSRPTLYTPSSTTRTPPARQPTCESSAGIYQLMSERNGKEPVPLDPTLDFFAGTVAGVAALLVGHPFDTVKVRFQNPATASKYQSTFHAFATIAREERVLGLYKGVTSPLVRPFHTPPRMRN
ncbi:hypothetical protein EVG20_g10883 [Dentipellis fragilis]|uniref:Uncharacterized protein n=1 Tax=Dentipellis fragilis TaxID=205917 RepID=A0A4Y9XPJ7_9AGAM|nr:hypothetical protein EVG20_g10883 [Dentipellis fragilis]